MTRRIPILTYHAAIVDGRDYASNDHVALDRDLEILQSEGWRLIPLMTVVRAYLDNDFEKLPERCVALTFDDGSWFDWYDLEYPGFGRQKSFATILREHIGVADRSGIATSFVIASPQARRDIDRACLSDQGWMDDAWWSEAGKENMISIQNHTWDHKHAAVNEEHRHGNEYGHFNTIETLAECDFQVRQAQDFIHRKLGNDSCQLLAYPFGDKPALMIEQYLPQTHIDLGLLAAFTIDPEPMTQKSNRWLLPRYVCRRDWQNEQGLLDILTSIS